MNSKGITTRKLILFVIIIALIITFLFFYFYNQRKRNFVTMAKEYISDVREMVTEDKIILPDTKDEAVVISISQIDSEKKLGKSSFHGDIVKDKSYIIIRNSGTEYTPVYDYYITIQDTKGYCINNRKEQALNRNSVDKNCNIKTVPETEGKYYK